MDHFPNQHINNPHWKSIIIGFLLIALLAGLFWYKNKLTQMRKIDLHTLESVLDENQTIPTANAQEVFLSINKDQVRIIDIRTATEYANEHIESSVNIPFNKDDPDFSKQLASGDKTLIVVEEIPTNAGVDLVKNLVKQGYRAKYLKGGMIAYRDEDYGLISLGNPESAGDKAKVNFISIQELIDRTEKGETFVFLDVREKNNYSSNRIEGSINIPLELLEKNKNEIPLAKIVLVDENVVRILQAAVRLYDMNVIGVYCLNENLSNLRSAIEAKNNPAPAQ